MLLWNLHPNPLFGPLEFVFAFNITYKCFLLCMLGCMLYNGHRFFLFFGQGSIPAYSMLLKIGFKINFIQKIIE
jgi:hypothetical protein